MPAPHLTRLLVGLGAASSLCVAAVGGIALATGSASHGFLAWNLVLAWVPLGLAACVRAAERERLPLPLVAAVLAAWLLFLPNAPYLATDLIHVGRLNAAVPALADLALLGTAAATGTLLGLVSLLVVEQSLARRVGRRAARTIAAAAIVLSGLGVYLGRILRWNSWDAVLAPHDVLGSVLSRLADPAAQGRMLTGVALVALALGAAYALLRHRLEHAGAATARERRRASRLE